MGISYDSAIVTLEHWRLHARAPGEASVDFYIGDSWAHWWVQVYERAQTLQDMRPGDHRAVPVRLAGGEMLSLQIPRSPPTYSVTILPGPDTLRIPRLAVLASNCNGGLTTSRRSYWCFALPGASVVAYHPKHEHPKEAWSGMIAVSLDRGPGGLSAKRRLRDGREWSWVVLGASRGETGILGEGIRQALLRDPTYGPALSAASAMLAAP